MTEEQIGTLVQFVAGLALLFWRVYTSGRRNTPAATATRLANGHGSKRDTDEIRMYRERELLADRAMADDLADLKRWRSAHQQDYFESRLREMAFQRATEESIRHLEEITQRLVEEYRKLKETCEGAALPAEARP